MENIKAGSYWSDITDAYRIQLAGLLLDMGYVRGSAESLVEQGVDKLFMPHGEEGPIILPLLLIPPAMNYTLFF